MSSDPTPTRVVLTVEEAEAIKDYIDWLCVKDRQTTHAAITQWDANKMLSRLSESDE